MKYYFAVFMPTVEEHYAVEFPDFPEGFTQGNDLADCLVMGADVLAIAVEEYAKARKPLPEPSSFEQVKAWAERQKGSEGLVPDRDFLFQLFQAPSVDMTPVRVSVSFAKSALDAIDAKAKRAGFTRSGFLAHAAQHY
ncbi:MAG: type II toxin-antitoxin system HicB family antitoxin, partial [Clostridiales bacterium]|nr:type II toxin-antitoxin system HicB family antitoxin [Clostridiales bacterium]